MNDLQVLAAALRRERPPDAVLSDRLVDLAQAHGVAALLAGTPLAHTASAGVALRLKALVPGAEALTAVRDRELTRVLAALAAGGVSPILIKGAHLAHTIYPSAAMRPRQDTDLVVAEGELASAAALITGAGYVRAVHVRGGLILGQWHFERVDDLGVSHALDLHWRLAAPLVVRHVLPAAVLRASCLPLSALGPHARVPAPAHALAIACVHLMAHHRRDPVLIWLYEIDKLADTLDAGQIGVFLDTAAGAGISTLCAAGLDAAREYFDGAALSTLAARLRAQGAARVEPSARLLSASRPIDLLWLDLRSAAGWRERMTLLREHLCPDAEYMRATGAGTGSLPLAYVRRALWGARDWIRATEGPRKVSYAPTGGDRRTAAPAVPFSGSAAESVPPVPARTIR